MRIFEKLDYYFFLCDGNFSFKILKQLITFSCSTENNLCSFSEDHWQHQQQIGSLHYDHRQ